MPPGDGVSSLNMFLATYFLVVAIVLVASLIFNIVVYWRICAKAGYSGAMGLLILVPGGALIMLCILAFGDWPALRELNQLRAMHPQAAFPLYQQGQPQFPQPGPFPQYAPPMQPPIQPPYMSPGSPYGQAGQSYPNNSRYE